MAEETKDDFVFDLEGYISKYPLLMLVAELKRTPNVDDYLAAAAEASEFGVAVDEQWVAGTQAASAEKQKKLEAELNVYKSNLIKESIRMGYNDLGDFFYERGVLDHALKHYRRTRDYCTQPQHIVSMSLNLIKVYIELHSFQPVAMHVAKAECTPGFDDPSDRSKLACATALEALEQGRFQHAANALLTVHPVMGDSFAEIVHAEDVALYAGVCALASFERAEIKSKVLDNKQFAPLLDLFPSVREMLLALYHSRFADCMQRLAELLPRMQLDVFLGPQARELERLIRRRALVQFCEPYVTLDLRRMADAFGCSVSRIEDDVAALISEDRIQARIDSQNKVLYARHADQRRAAFRRTLALSDAFARDVRLLALRVSMSKSGVFLQPSAAEGDRAAFADLVGMAAPGRGMGLGMAAGLGAGVGAGMGAGVGAMRAARRPGRHH